MPGLPSKPLPDPTPHFSLGQQPSPIQPTAIPDPVGIDTGAFAKAAAGAFNPVAPMIIPNAPHMEAPVGMDYSPFIEQMSELAPKDPRIAPDEVFQKKLNRGFVGAAQGAAGGDELGETLMLAAAGFLGGQEGFDTEQRELGIAFDESMRAFNSQILAAKMDAEEAKIRVENATNEVEFANATADHNVALARAEELQSTAREAQEMKRAELGFNLDLAQLGADQTNQRNEVRYQNQENMRQHVNSIIAQKSPRMVSMSPDGKFITMQRTDPKTGETILSQEPMGILGQVEQMAQLAMAVPGIGTDLVRQNEYEAIQKFAPQYLKRKIIKDILASPHRDKILDPGEYSPKSLGEWFDLPKQVGDYFTTSKMENAIKEAERIIESRTSQGLLDPANAVNEFNSILAQLLEDDFDSSMLARARMIEDPALRAGLDLLGE